MRQVLYVLAVLAGLGLAGAAAVVGLGLYNVSAQVGHLPGIGWILHRTFRNSVRLRAPGMEDAPDLSDPDLVALGAGHYATACAPCHAAPGTARSATMQAMLPAPPAIEEAVAHWKPNELHWIVENGIKMSGMPAWPAQGRKDEVWAVVAYLAAIKARAAPPLREVDVESDPQAYCNTCHGRIGGRVPRLELLDPDYLTAKLDDYRRGIRPSGIMQQAVSLVPRARDADLARYLTSGTETPVAGDAGDAAMIARGEVLAKRGTRDLPACLACHAGGKDSKGPPIAGQPSGFLTMQMRLWRDGTYHSDALMQHAAEPLSDADIAALAAYFAQAEPR